MHINLISANIAVSLAWFWRYGMQMSVLTTGPGAWMASPSRLHDIHTRIDRCDLLLQMHGLLNTSTCKNAEIRTS